MLGLLAGIGFGIYLSILIAPFIIAALAATLSHGMAIFAVIVASLVLVAATMYMLTQPLIILSTLRDIARTVFKFIGTQEYFLNTVYLASLTAGASLGIYASLYVAPLVINTLIGISLSYNLALFTAIAVSIALIGLATWVCSTIGTGLGLGLRILPLQFKSNESSIKPDSAKKPLAAFTLARAVDIMSVVADPNGGHIACDDYPEQESKLPKQAWPDQSGASPISQLPGHPDSRRQTALSITLRGGDSVSAVELGGSSSP